MKSLGGGIFVIAFSGGECAAAFDTTYSFFCLHGTNC